MGDCLRDESWAVPGLKGVTLTVLQNPLRTCVHSTGEAAFRIPLHWHASHDEIHVMLKGTVIITQGNVRKVLRPEDGACIRPRGVVHGLEFCAGEEAIMEETTIPVEPTEQKIIFFRNLFFPGMLQSFLGVMQVFYYGDAYPKLPTGFRWLEWPMVVVLGRWVAPLLGYQLPDKRLRLDPNRFPPNKKD
ncbi:hypothetical protein DFH07DRAFT_787545 [Mycena maculata]|uniref:Uncharacterized protein n=1 Tax=Mycena maculata TaxID=230809 RepID=A0AAD7KIG8_9AGAR|nr:hypothetical protein DFH07DRAFT_787545 [Mycena maculata]